MIKNPIVLLSRVVPGGEQQKARSKMSNCTTEDSCPFNHSKQRLSSSHECSILQDADSMSMAEIVSSRLHIIEVGSSEILHVSKCVK